MSYLHRTILSFLGISLWVYGAEKKPMYIQSINSHRHMLQIIMKLRPDKKQANRRAIFDQARTPLTITIEPLSDAVKKILIK